MFSFSVVFNLFQAWNVLGSNANRNDFGKSTGMDELPPLCLFATIYYSLHTLGVKGRYKKAEKATESCQKSAGP